MNVPGACYPVANLRKKETPYLPIINAERFKPYSRTRRILVSKRAAVSHAEAVSRTDNFGDRRLLHSRGERYHQRHGDEKENPDREKTI